MASRVLTSLACAAALLLPACVTVNAASGSAGPGDFQYARDVSSKLATRVAEPKGEVTIVWRYGTQAWVNNMCGGRPGGDDVFGCSMQDPNSDRCVMFLVAPKDFQDRERLAVLGHELWHCTGARHS